MKIESKPLILKFKNPAGTSRGFMTEKRSWIVAIEVEGIQGIGEISIIEGLSKEFRNTEEFEEKIHDFCDKVAVLWQVHQNMDQISYELPFISNLINYPSILFGLESAIIDLNNGGGCIYFDNDFTNGLKKIPINGLIWMGEKSFMEEQIDEKLQQGFKTIKMKIGAIDIEAELEIISAIRSRYNSDQITLRVDANGAFNHDNAKTILQKLSELGIHSIEQPIPAGQRAEMAELCASTPTPIALDEELIGISELSEKKKLLDEISPQYIVLKPSLHGGVSGTKEWIQLAEERNIGWWITSALESNIGLNVICQLAAEYDNQIPQGLGTGSLYTNNTPSDLKIANGNIFKEKRT